MSPKFNIGDIFSGKYEYCGVHKQTGKLQVFQDEISYKVLDVHHPVQGNTRHQIITMETSYGKGRVVAGFYDRCTRKGQLNEKNTSKVIKITEISLSTDGQLLTLQFAMNSVKSLDFDYYTFVAILSKQ